MVFRFGTVDRADRHVRELYQEFATFADAFAAEALLTRSAPPEVRFLCTAIEMRFSGYIKPSAENCAIFLWAQGSSAASRL